jgi:hypothetical protein
MAKSASNRCYARLRTSKCRPIRLELTDMSTVPRHAGGDWTPGDVAAMVANPFYAIEIDPKLGDVELTVSDEEWVEANATAIARNPKRWLRMLLRVLQGEEFPGDTPESALAALANPAAAIEIHPTLLLPHEAVIDEATWVAANLKTVEELGPKPWLYNLLSVLSGHYVAGAD